MTESVVNTFSESSVIHEQKESKTQKFYLILACARLNVSVDKR